MTLKEIAMFKTFMRGRGLDKLFVGMYNSYRVGANPRSLEEYLVKVGVHEVFAKAFLFEMQSFTKSEARTYAYWEHIQDLFETYMEANEHLFVAADIQQIMGRGKVLRYNWDNGMKGTGGKQDRKTTSNRYMELLSKYVTTTKTEDENSEETSNADSIGSVSNIEFFDLTNRTPSVGKLGETELLVYARFGNSRVIFNRAHSKEILRSGLIFMNIGRDEYTGQVRIVFNNENGLSYAPSSAKEGRVVINSKKLINLLSKLFAQEGNDMYTLRISKNISPISKYLTYNIDNAQ